MSTKRVAAKSWLISFTKASVFGPMWKHSVMLTRSMRAELPNFVNACGRPIASNKKKKSPYDMPVADAEAGE
jgi:hypothetical protein